MIYGFNLSYYIPENYVRVCLNLLLFSYWKTNVRGFLFKPNSLGLVFIVIIYIVNSNLNFFNHTFTSLSFS